jgi:hypothetical protein
MSMVRDGKFPLGSSIATVAGRKNIEQGPRVACCSMINKFEERNEAF